MKRQTVARGVGAVLVVMAAGCAQTDREPQMFRTRVPEVQVQKREAATIVKSSVELASAYYAAGQFSTAQEVLAPALAADASNVQVLGLAGLIAGELRDDARAREYFATALRLAPENADLNHNWGVYLCKRGDPAGAMSYLQKAIAAPGNPRPANSLAAGASCLVRLGRDDEALQYLTAALRFDALHAHALIGLADLQVRRGSDAEAQATLNRLSKVAVPSAESLWLHVRVARRLGRSSDEQLYASDLRSSFPESPQAAQLAAQQYD